MRHGISYSTGDVTFSSAEEDVKEMKGRRRRDGKKVCGVAAIISTHTWRAIISRIASSVTQSLYQ